MVTFSPDLPHLGDPPDNSSRGLGLGPLPGPPLNNEISGIFSYLANRPPYSSTGAGGGNVRWPSFSGGGGNRSFWTKYCLLCTVCGSAATILAGIFLVVAALFRHYTTSINYFETVPTYIPAILLSICGVSTIAFSCKRNRNIILLRITACWSLCSAALSSVITITTSLIHMNRLQTLKECVFHPATNPPGCMCYSHVFGMGGSPDSVHYIFENTPDCDVIHGILYSCLRAVFAISVVAVLLSIFLCMLLYQLIGHERKKAYWSRIRRINSDWSADFIACLARPVPRERSSVLPLVMSPSGTTISSGGVMSGWGPPPPYEEVADDPPEPSNRPFLRPLFPPQPSSSSTNSSNMSRGIVPSTSSSYHNQNPNGPGPSRPSRVLRLVNSQSENSFRNADGLISPHPFSPTITSIDPVSVFRCHQDLSQSYAGRIDNPHFPNDPGSSSSSQYCMGNTGLIQSYSSRLGDLSMSSITSLSIPETLKSSCGSNSNSNSTAPSTSTREAIREMGIPAGILNLDAVGGIVPSLSGNTIYDLGSCTLPIDPPEEGNCTEGLKLDSDLNNIDASNEKEIGMETEGKAPLLANSEPKIQNDISGSYNNYSSYSNYDSQISDKLLAISTKSSLSKISSLPCSPFLNIRKRFWQKGNKSVQNLSFSNVNFDFENLNKNLNNRRRLSRGKPESCLFIGENTGGGCVNGDEVGIAVDGVKHSKVKGSTGFSLPSSPQKSIKKSTESSDGIC